MHVHALLFALSLAQAPPTPEELVKLGEALVQHGDAKGAIPRLDKALADPATSDAQKARAEAAYGLALLQLKKPKDAVAHLENATKLDPNNEKGWQLLGVAHDAAEQFAEAIASYQKGVAAVPKSPTLKHELGMALLEAGRNDDAAKVLVDACKLAPNDPEIHMDAAYALTLTGAFKDAKEQASLAVSLAPDSPDAYYNLGRAEAGLGNAKAAKDALKRALDVDEVHVPSLVQLGLLESAAGDDASAAKRFMRVLQVEPDDAKAKAGLGVSLGKLGNDDVKAGKLLEEAVHVDPKNVQALALLGDVEERAGKLDDAIRHYESVKKLRPDDARVKKKLDELRDEKKKKSPH